MLTPDQEKLIAAAPGLLEGITPLAWNIISELAAAPKTITALLDERDRLTARIEALERRQGKWITKNNLVDRITCSVCNLSTYKPDDDSFYGYNYCRHCGAEMEEPK